MNNCIRVCAAVSLGLASFVSGKAQDLLDDVSKWDLSQAKQIEVLGRKAVVGTALLKDSSFEDGTIEFDIAFESDRVRCYAGVNFRIHGKDYERFYIRPHRSMLYNDVLQYVPAFNGVDSWQLYAGPGYSAGAAVPPRNWVHVRLEVKGSQARVFLNRSSVPSLEIPLLAHGASRGQIALTGPIDGSAYFSGFTVSQSADFAALPLVEVSPGSLMEWEISKPFQELRTDCDAYPKGDLGWRKAKADCTGLVDISRWYGRTDEPDLVYLRTTIHSRRQRFLKLDFGYSDVATLFLNGTPVFRGESSYQSRDSSFLGIVGFNDSVYLPLKKGSNELLVSLRERSGGWGFIARDAEAVFHAPGVKLVWESSKAFKWPETATLDPSGKAAYISNYDGLNASETTGLQSISRLNLGSMKLEQDWCKGLFNPTGMLVSSGKLWVVEPNSIACVDMAAAKVEKRYPVAGSSMLNDIALGPEGALYITDSPTGTIFRLVGDKVQPWVQDRRLLRANGLRLRGTELIVATNLDHCLKSIDLNTKEIKTVCRMGQGVIDGIRVLPNGGLLVSHTEGRIYLVRKDGTFRKLIDLTTGGIRLANFDFFAEGGLLVAPTFNDNRIRIYKIDPSVLK